MSYLKDSLGELSLAVGLDPSRKAIILDFGKSVTWVGLDAASARELAAMLTEKAALLDERKQ